MYDDPAQVGYEKGPAREIVGDLVSGCGCQALFHCFHSAETATDLEMVARPTVNTGAVN